MKLKSKVIRLLIFSSLVIYGLFVSFNSNNLFKGKAKKEHISPEKYMLQQIKAGELYLFRPHLLLTYNNGRATSDWKELNNLLNSMLEFNDKTGIVDHELYGFYTLYDDQDNPYHNPQKGYNFLVSSAKKGHLNGQRVMAYLLAQGDSKLGIEKKPTEAFSWCLMFEKQNLVWMESNNQFELESALSRCKEQLSLSIENDQLDDIYSLFEKYQKLYPYQL